MISPKHKNYVSIYPTRHCPHIHPLCIVRHVRRKPRPAFSGNRGQSLNHFNVSRFFQQHNQREVMNSLSQAILALIVPYLYTITPFRTPPVQAVVGRRGRLPHTRPYHANGSTLLNVGHSKTSVSWVPIFFAFQQVFGTATRRQRFLRRLHYEIDLPPPNDRNY